MTKFEDELRQTIENGDTKYAFRAAELLLDILPELRGLVWQPIESAPIGGDPVLVFVEEYACNGEDCSFVTTGYFEDDYSFTPLEGEGDYVPLRWAHIPSTTLTEKLKKAGVI